MDACGQWFSPEVVGRIEAAVAAEPSISRRALSRQVCEWLDWRGTNGRLKDMSCRVALKRLESRGVLTLPRAGRGVVGSARRRCGEAIGTAVEASLAEVGPVELVLVGSRESAAARVWRGLMERDHPHGAGPLCGAQLRYLIRSPRHGWLGGLAFSSAAWRLEDRERWIGWTEPCRRAHLPKVVSNSRFLIRPEVHVPHLASHVLSRCLRRLPQDWQARYGVEPVLAETFVEVDRYAGTSYRAANWQHIGETRGRGRQDRGHRKPLPVKHLYVYPLTRRWRDLLCEPPTAAVATSPPPLPRRDRPAPADWAEEEFGRARLGDARLAKRLLGVARDFFGKPQANIPQACGSRARTKAAYRFFDHPDVTMDVVLPSHIEATRERLRSHRVVLAVQDTTTLNYTAHPATEGLGVLGSIDDLAAGLIVHDTMAFTVDGTPLGLLDVQCWARDGSTQGQGKHRERLPIEQKESAKWLRSYRHVSQAQKDAPDTMLVSVGDREADLYDLFAEAARDPAGPRLLVRAERSRSRKVEQGPLWDHMAAQPVAGFQELHVPRKGSRPARTARLAVRFAQVALEPPARSKYPPVPVWAVYAHEVDHDPHIVKQPLSWLLLTTVQTASFDEACERLAWYTRRWGIEVYHRTLKSGCRIENRQLATAKRLEACLAVDLVVAWRVYHLAKLGRDLPDAPCTVYFQDSQWKALTAFVTRNPVAPAKPPSLRRALRWVAGLGGFLGRKGDGEPGTQTLWLGLQRLDDITSIWCVFAGVPQLRPPAVSSHDDYG
jgi:hypothetical protein